MAESDPQPLQDVKHGTLQINGIMARLQNGKMTTENAVSACNTVTEKIDIAASNISRVTKLDNISLRSQMRILRHGKIKMNQDMNKMQRELDQAHQKIKELQVLNSQNVSDMELLSFIEDES